ncbi:hypothetical protein TR2A62_3653 [Thalassobium sp. R2A62]|nr:hypothetical protein TR2A62_3653 [Thalassobium sp. R2A62]
MIQRVWGNCTNCADEHGFGAALHMKNCTLSVANRPDVSSETRLSG